MVQNENKWRRINGHGRIKKIRKKINGDGASLREKNIGIQEEFRTAEKDA